MKSKTKHIVFNDDTTYLLNFGDFQAEETGANILNRLRREFWLERMLVLEEAENGGNTPDN